ncbi:hypothetical protein BKA57DRAFT_452622 [Linnemannia elongata]|nr:hypothetical protein BKA57DRAFT_452622 [Linnemannia elongata]
MLFMSWCLLWCYPLMLFLIYAVMLSLDFYVLTLALGIVSWSCLLALSLDVVSRCCLSMLSLDVVP